MSLAACRRAAPVSSFIGAIWGIVLVVPVIAGCATSRTTTHPASERLRGIKTMALLPPQVEVVEVDQRIGNRYSYSERFRDDLSDKARGHLARAIVASFEKDERLALREFEPESPDARSELDAARRRVLPTVRLRGLSTASESPVVEGVELVSVGESLEPLLALADASQADALLFVHAVDHTATGHYTARRILGAPIGLAFTPLAILLSPFRGVERTRQFLQLTLPVPLETRITAVLVHAATGEVVWTYTRLGSYNLQDPASVDSLVAEMFDAFRRRSR